jgi:hypothetical protein
MAYNQELAQAERKGSALDFFEAYLKDPERVQHTLPFDPEWAGGTGYFEALIREELPSVKVGEVATSTDNYGRRLLIVKTRFGNVIVFERHSPDKDGQRSGIFVVNDSGPLRSAGMLGEGGALSKESMMQILGDSCVYWNVGTRVEGLFNFKPRHVEEVA